MLCGMGIGLRQLALVKRWQLMLRSASVMSSNALKSCTSILIRPQAQLRACSKPLHLESSVPDLHLLAQFLLGPAGKVVSLHLVDRTPPSSHQLYNVGSKPIHKACGPFDIIPFSFQLKQLALSHQFTASTPHQTKDIMAGRMEQAAGGAMANQVTSCTEIMCLPDQALVAE